MPDFALEVAQPQSLGFCPRRWKRVLETAEKLCHDKKLVALGLEVQRHGLTTGPHFFGHEKLNGGGSPSPETYFLVASLTKPVTAMAVMLLVERGLLTLNQRVCELIPEFRDAAKRPMTVRHLLTHTSGLPDMLPNNQELRKNHASLARFVSESCEAELNFPPGRGAQYQSMGYAVLGPIIEQVTGESYRRFMRRELFEPLGMQQTWMGLPDDLLESARIAEVQVPESQRGGEDWNWNSRYWLQLGVPWGGLISTVSDMSRFCRAMLQGGTSADGGRLFSPATIQLATTNRLGDFPSMPEADRRTRGWGLGWRLNWSDHRGTFGDLVPAHAYGHWGATGTLAWIDPLRELAVVMLSTTPLTDDGSPLVGLSNSIAAALEGS
ncbi:serine hydrolase domain-containing protein [Planctomicrobium sp. SH664]|uniref:serine hydrolase domain-containing protein n=1 Tax=Planctomicrobium sp. SH664 TaxID=3448125 RepID=UPI003F5B13D3